MIVRMKTPYTQKEYLWADGGRLPVEDVRFFHPTFYGDDSMDFPLEQTTVDVEVSPDENL
jgi:hypothetical protein